MKNLSSKVKANKCEINVYVYYLSSMSVFLNNFQASLALSDSKVRHMMRGATPLPPTSTLVATSTNEHESDNCSKTGSNNGKSIVFFFKWLVEENIDFPGLSSGASNLHHTTTIPIPSKPPILPRRRGKKILFFERTFIWTDFDFIFRFSLQNR